MLIAQISDLHIAAPGTKTYGVAAMDDKLKAVIAHLNTCQPRPDVVLVTGDLTNAGSGAETAYARQLLEGLEMPYFVMAGNHDSAGVMAQVFDETRFPPAAGDQGDYVLDDFAVRLIGMDSTCSGGPGGQLSTDQLAWLDKELAGAPDKPTFVCMHHPPVCCGVPETDEDGFEASSKLGEIIARHSHVERILCGHIHLPVQARWNGTLVCAAPSIGMHLDVELSGDAPSRFVLGDPAYLLHHLHKYGHILTHVKTLAPVSSSYGFHDHSSQVSRTKR